MSQPDSSAGTPAASPAVSPPEGLPTDVWQAVQAAAKGEGDPHEVGAVLVAWADGRGLDSLVALLDALRATGAYPVSLYVLEAAWGAGLPLDQQGAVAQDWIGTILFGIGDREGANLVANKIAPEAIERSPQLAGDLGDLLLSWSLRKAARPLIEAAVEALPGDTSHRFNLGVLQKFAGEYSACRESFESVVRHTPSPEAHWNLGIACTALRDFDAARAAWKAIGLSIPEGTGDFAAPGAAIPVSLATSEGAPARREIVWGSRLCPARVRLDGLPRWSAEGTYGDIVLIDGAPIQEIMSDGEKVPVLPALSVFESFEGETVEVFGDDPSLSHDLAQVALRLNESGWPAANWSELPGEAGCRMGLVIPADKTRADARAALLPLIEDMDLQHPALDPKQAK